MSSFRARLLAAAALLLLGSLAHADLSAATANDNDNDNDNANANANANVNANASLCAPASAPALHWARSTLRHLYSPSADGCSLRLVAPRCDAFGDASAI